jgi:hypothetical protein
VTSTPLAVLDACVLANFSLCDSLLRLAEPPRLFEPKWSEEIIRETTRTLESKLGWSVLLTAHLEAELRANFGEAWISGDENLISRRRTMKKIAMCLLPRPTGRVNNRDSESSGL